MVLRNYSPGRWGINTKELCSVCTHLTCLTSCSLESVCMQWGGADRSRYTYSRSPASLSLSLPLVTQSGLQQVSCRTCWPRCGPWASSYFCFFLNCLKTFTFPSSNFERWYSVKPQKGRKCLCNCLLISQEPPFLGIRDSSCGVVSCLALSVARDSPALLCPTLWVTPRVPEECSFRSALYEVFKFQASGQLL